MRWLGVLALTSVAAAQEGEPAVSFFDDVRPILQASCQGCHQPAKPEGDVVLVRHADMLRAFDGAEAVVRPGAPELSVLIDVVTPFGDVPPEMPEEGEPLTAEQVDLLRRWIREGALDDTPADATRGAGELPVYARAPVVTSLDFSPDGELLAVSGRGEVLLHRSDGSELVARLVGLSERIESVEFSPDGTRLAAAGGSPGLLGELQIWSVAEAKLELSIPVTFDTIQGVSWSHDGTRVAFGCKDNTVRVVDAKTGAQVLYQNAHEDWVLGTAFSSDDSHLVSAGRDRSLKLIKVETEQFIDNITSITPGALRGGLMSVELHPARDEVLVGGADGAPKLYRIFREDKRVIGDDYNLLQAFEPLPGRVFSTAWSPEGDRIAAGSSLAGKGEVRMYVAAGGELAWARSFDAGIYAIAYHPQADRLAVGGFDGRVRLLDASDGTLAGAFVPVPIAEAGLIEAAVELGSAQPTPGGDS